jgi:NADPH2:quinone reductase
MGSMKAIGFTENLPSTDPRSLVDLDREAPEPGGHDLLVEVHAVSVNPVDVKQRANRKPDAGGTILGFDAAGIVVSVGDAVELFEVGDAVYYAGTNDRPGSNSQYQLVDERIVGHKPSSLGFADAAALPLTTITAWEVLFDRFELTESSVGTMLVVGASGGVGSMILQLLDALVPGITVIGTASRPDAEKWEHGLGAEHTVDHHGDLAQQVLAIAPDGIEWIFSSHSDGQLATFAAMLKPFGQIAAIDDPKTLDVVPLKSKSIAFHWEFMFTRPLHHTPDLVAQHELLDEVAGLIDAGRLVTTATVRLSPLDAEQLREAHRLVEDGTMIGKVVVSGWPA